MSLGDPDLARPTGTYVFVALTHRSPALCSGRLLAAASFCAARDEHGHPGTGNMRRPVVANRHLRCSSMTDEDVQELIALLHEAQTEWVNGTFNSLFDLSQATVFPPFGGPAIGGPGFSEGQARMATQFHDGTT